MPTFSGTEKIGAGPEQVWAFMMDPRRFTACAPAMRNVQVKNEREFSFEVAAPGRDIKFEAKWDDLQAPTHARLRMHGGSRFAGGAKMDSEFRMTADAAGAGAATTVDWSTEVELSGAAKFLLPDEKLREMVNEMNQDVIACIRRQIEGAQ
jgi:carbon monoxide dehydrogenase subunit G